MAKPYPQELRDRVLAAYDRGMKTRQIADVFAVSPAWKIRGFFKFYSNLSPGAEKNTITKDIGQVFTPVL